MVAEARGRGSERAKGRLRQVRRVPRIGSGLSPFISRTWRDSERRSRAQRNIASLSRSPVRPRPQRGIGHTLSPQAFPPRDGTSPAAEDHLRVGTASAAARTPFISARDHPRRRAIGSGWGLWTRPARTTFGAIDEPSGSPRRSSTCAAKNGLTTPGLQELGLALERWPTGSGLRAHDRR